MKKKLLAAAVWSAGVLMLIVGVAVAGRTAPGGNANPPHPSAGPELKPDTGAGEMLLVVLGGVFDSRAEAEAANAAMSFGDLQGYYVVPVAQFQGFEESVGDPRDFALVSAFRTEAGAQGFVDMATAFGYPARVLPARVRSLGGAYAGLGQEAAPDGSGPLLGPIPDSLP